MNYLRLLFIALICLVLTPMDAAVTWYTDYTQARQLGQKENKPLLLFFNGSDWSGWAMKIKHEVLDDASFQEKIESNFVFVEVDFPKHTTLSEKVKKQNSKLKKQFEILETPSMLIVDANERLIAKISYLPDSGDQLANDLLRMVNQDSQLLSALQKLPTDSAKLQKLYQLAQELRRQAAVDQILAAGLKAQDPFFFTEKYRFLVEQGKMTTDEAQTLRQKLFSLDPKNKKRTHFTVALIDFQELSQGDSPVLAAQPLKDYLEKFGEQDSENVWRIEMMIAQLYLEADAWESALKHALKAYDKAPEAMHEEIAYSLDYIRSRTDAIAQK